MDEKSKTPLLPQSSSDAVTEPPQSQELQPHMSRRSAKSRFQIAAAVFLISLFWLARTWNADHEHLETETKVPMDVHIMSKCPDARECMRKLVVPTMANVSDKVELRLSFIGR